MMFFNQQKQNFEPLNLIPSTLKSSLAISDNVLCISSAIKHDPLVLELLNDLKSRKIVEEYAFYSPAEFHDKYSHSTLSKIEVKNEIQNFVKELLQTAFNEKASDIHIKDMGTHGLIRFRIDGMLIDHKIYKADFCRAVIRAIYGSMIQSGDSQFSYRERQEGRIVNDNFLPKGMYSVRVHTEPTEKKDSPEGIGSCMYLRLLYDATNATGSLEERLTRLGFLNNQIESIRYLTTRTGLNILSGATGHGKSTALKHIIESIKIENPQKAFMSVEDPPEFHLEGIDQIAVSTKNVENRGIAYTDAIAGAMRSDVDCLLIGEIRYLEATKAAINGAMTGHAIWGTLHASDAIGIILRMITILEEKGSSNAIKHICEPSVISGLEYQRLIPMLCPHCSKRLHDVIDSYNANMAEKINRALKAEDENVRVIGSGCEYCNYKGIKGQQIAAEVITTDVAFLDYLKQNKITKAKEYWIKEKGGISHVQHALKYVKEGRADPFITEDRLGLPLDFEVIS